MFAYRRRLEAIRGPSIGASRARWAEQIAALKKRVRPYVLSELDDEDLRWFDGREDPS
jgi:hypothetical protein